MILAPCLIMATMLTASVRRALRIESVRPADFAVSLVLGVTLHPAYTLFAGLIQQEFQIGADTRVVLEQIEGLISSAPLWSVLLTLAIVRRSVKSSPFELHFRRIDASKRNTARHPGIGVVFRSIAWSSPAVDRATVMGLVLGWIAWRSGGVLCGIALHLTHNALTMLVARAGKAPDSIPSQLDWMFDITSNQSLGLSSVLGGDKHHPVGNRLGLVLLSPFGHLPLRQPSSSWLLIPNRRAS